MRMNKSFLGAVAAMVFCGGIAHAQAKEGWPADIKIGTASQGGTFAIVGSGLASLLNDKLGVNASAEITGGPVQNVTLLQTGEHQLALSTLGPAKEAWDGLSALAPGLEHHDLRALLPMYVTPFQTIALKSSGISSIADMDGTRVNFGPATGTSGTYFPQIYDALGIKARASFSGGADAASQLTDGLIDAISFAGGVPIPFFSQLTVEADVTMFGLTEDERAKVLAALPALSEFTIKAGTYSGHDYDQPTVGIWNFVLANAAMPEDLAYEITKTVLENNNYMKQVHSVTNDMIAENWAANKVIPFHPGAARYLREKGYEVPDAMIGH